MLEKNTSPLDILSGKKKTWETEDAIEMFGCSRLSDYFISSKGKRILIVSDIHCGLSNLCNVIKRVNPDLTICLGDWFDNFHILLEEQIASFDFLIKFIEGGNVNLMGNHDMNYLFGKHKFLCSGYDSSFHKLVENKKSKIKFIKSKTKWFYCVDNFLLTHAGLDFRALKCFRKGQPKNNLKDICLGLADESEFGDVEKCIKRENRHWFFEVCALSGGDCAFGGIVWNRPRYMQTIENVNQIFGHTNGQFVRFISNEQNPNGFETYSSIFEMVGKEPFPSKVCNSSALNICIDNSLRKCILIEDGVFKFV